MDQFVEFDPIAQDIPNGCVEMPYVIWFTSPNSILGLGRMDTYFGSSPIGTQSVPSDESI
jgi:hypothetical protein